MVLDNVKLQELKEIELEMLKLFVEVCKKLNLRYYVIGGTVLGTVRHKGFIPWDDDIDVGMPREDYEVFLKKAQELLPEQYFVQTCFTDKEFPANFCKIRNSNTTFIETSVKNRQMNHGAYIDVFPLDWHPDNKKDIKIFNLKNKYYLFVIARSYHKKKKKNYKQFVGKILTMFTSVKRGLKKRDKLLKSNKGKTYLANYSGAWGEKEIMPACWYDSGVELEFEGVKVVAPKEYDAWLTQVYGDYMQFPPEEKRVSHHHNEIIDLKKSYKEYVKQGEI